MDNASLPSPARTMDSTPLFVALYVVLLAFFIMLHAISKPDHRRANIVLDSLNQAFSNVENALAPRIMQAVGVEVSVTEFFDAVKKLARTTLAVETMGAVRTGNTMTLTFPLEKLFAPGYTTPRQETSTFLAALAEELTRPTAGAWIEVQCLVGYAPDAPTSPGSLEVKRAGGLARALVDMEVPARTISAGIHEGEPQTVRFVFHIRRVSRSGLPLVPLNPVTASAAP